MLKVREFTSFDEFEESGTAGNYEEVTIVRENGWVNCDVLTECKSWKTALRRFFKALGSEGVFDGWYEGMREAGENGCFKANDFTMGNGEKNPLPSWAYEIEESAEGVWYIFLNLREAETETESAESAETEKEENKMEFTEIKKRVQEDHEKRASDTAHYIKFGFMPSWAEENRTESDRGLKEHSTETRWAQYQRGEISREKAVELATRQVMRELEKSTAAKIAALDRVAAAPDCEFISVSVEWVRSSVWGYNPRVEVRTNTGTFSGTASGCGYDKESAAIGEAFNRCDSILKALYTLKENGLRAGQTDESKSATCGRSNGDICGYGAGYGAIPYFEGGVGASCFWAILKRCGFKVRENHEKKCDFYSAEKEVA